MQEYILATVAQHQRRKEAEHTKNRMRACVLIGYWPFACPISYRYERASGHGKMIVPREPVASIIGESLEGFASAASPAKRKCGAPFRHSWSFRRCRTVSF